MSLSMSSESTRFWLQYDPLLIFVACSQTELSISEKLWEIRQASFTENAKIVNWGSNVVHVKVHVLSFHTILISSQ